MKLLTKTVVMRKGSQGRPVAYARIRWEDHTGRIRTQEKRATSRTAAKALRDQMAARFEAEGPPKANADRLTFADLARQYIEERCVPAVYAGERKIAGQKHPEKLRNHVERLVSYFGPRRLLELQQDWEAVQTYKMHLLATPTQHGRPRSIHDVNNQLRILRAVLNFGRRKGWIHTSPFLIGEPLINPGDELPRAREERPGEIEALLAVCTGRRAHLRPWIVVAHQTAARPGEVSRIERRDLLWDEGLIRLRASTTKTNRERFVPMTESLRTELRAWLEFVASDPGWSREVPDEPTARIFGKGASNKTAFFAACREAGIANLQRKDLRKFSTTRLVAALEAAGIHHIHGMAITGHTQEKTFRTYIVTGKAMAQEVAAALEAWQQRKQEAQLPTEESRESKDGVDGC